ncbi:MAG: diguanylate cyclase [Candidatus Omnitrophica bacterium]|nr:diguanylate cyclase [Candidatus Omnitrophota bacterium]
MKKQKTKISQIPSLSRGLKYKLRIALYLMTVLPLLVTGYIISTYLLPVMGFKLEIIISLSISVMIAVLGFFIVKEVFDRVLSVSTEAKLIAAGDISRRLSLERDDEVGDLGDALNQLTHRIRSNMDELKSYSEKTTEINLEIQKRILVLSSLLQISSLISQTTGLDEILKVTVEKSRFIANSDLSYLLFKQDNSDRFSTKIADGPHAQRLFKIEVEFDKHALNRVLNSSRYILLDKDNKLPDSLKEIIQQQLQLKNTLALPIYIKGRLAGVLGIGNSREEFVFKRDDVDLLDVFAKQIAIAVENDLLMHRIEKLEIKDPLTGLYNESFINNRLQEEIKRAITYQRPCAFVLFNVDNFLKFQQAYGSLQAEGILKKVGTLIRDSVTEIDRVGRIGDNDFAIILPEKNKRHAQTIAEEIRKKIQFAFNEEEDVNKRITCSAGVSENPLDGIDSEELLRKARDKVKEAKAQGKNRIAI